MRLPTELYKPIFTNIHDKHTLVCISTLSKCIQPSVEALLWNKFCLLRTFRNNNPCQTTKVFDLVRRRTGKYVKRLEFSLWYLVQWVTWDRSESEGDLKGSVERLIWTFNAMPNVERARLLDMDEQSAPDELACILSAIFFPRLKQVYYLGSLSDSFIDFLHVHSDVRTLFIGSCVSNRAHSFTESPRPCPILSRRYEEKPLLPNLRALETSNRQFRWANKDIEKDFRRLAERVIEMAKAYSDSMAHSIESRDIQLYTGSFVTSLENIASAVHKGPRRGVIARMASKLMKARNVRDLEEEFEHSSALLSLQLQMKNHQMSTKLASENNARQIEVYDAIATAQKEQIDLIRTRIIEASEKRCKESSTFSHYPPPTPQHFFGRDDHLEHLVSCIQDVPSYQAILGSGGIGKTCLSLRAFHDPRTITIYGRHRYFLSCETIQDADGLAAGLANIFDLQEKNIISQLRRVCSIIGTSILFLLDNFETPWERNETREKVEAILTDLVAIPNLSLLVTLRGGERPAGVSWTLPFFPTLKPISLEASKQLFLSIADVPDNDPCLEQLMRVVEGLPLAVTLLASQAQSSRCSLLLSAWEEQKTSMVTRGFGGRLSSLDTSINLSITSSRMRNVISSLPALQILSFLPDGATTEELVQMNPGQDKAALGGITLCQVSLAYFTDHQRLRVLSPIREYVRANYPPDSALLERILDYHCEASKYAAEAEKSPEWEMMVEKLAPSIGNIHSIILDGLLHESLASRAIQACVDIVAFHSCAFVGSVVSLLSTCLGQAKHFNFRKLEADCLFKLAVIRSVFQSPEAWSSLSTAIAIYRELNEKDALVTALCMSATNSVNRSQYTLAESNLTEASGLLSADSAPGLRLWFLIENGRLYTNTGDYPSAQQNFNAALLLLNDRTDPWSERALYGRLCYHYIHYDMYDAAVEAGRSALAVRGLRDHWKNLAVLYNMSDAYFVQGRVSEAEETMKLAFEISLRVANENHLARSKCYLADFAIANGKLDEAESHLRGAWVLSQSMGDGLLNLRLVSLLGQLEMLRNNTVTALAHFEEVKRMSQKLGGTLGDGLFYHIPMTYLLSRNKMASSSKTYGICSVIWCLDAKQDCDTAISLLVLGDAYLLEQDSDPATSRSCYEVAFGLLGTRNHRRGMAHALVRLAVVDRLQSASNSSPCSMKAGRRFNEVAKVFQEIEHYPAERYCLDQLHSIEANESMDVASVIALPYPW